MEKDLAVIRQTLKLLETILEGLDHTQSLLHEEKHNEVIIMFEDIVFAFTRIESALHPLLDSMENTKVLEKNVNNAGSSINKNVSILEAHRFKDMQFQLEEELIPVFQGLKSKLENFFQPYLLS